MTILAVSSSGGHWEQLQRLRVAFEGKKIIYATTMNGATTDDGNLIYKIPDCNRNEFMSMIRCTYALLGIIRREKPNFIVSTGAAPGLIALFLGKLLGAKVVWIDSVANSERLSLSGKVAGKFADLWITQWEHLQRPSGPHYAGSVL